MASGFFDIYAGGAATVTVTELDNNQVSGQVAYGFSFLRSDTATFSVFGTQNNCVSPASITDLIIGPDVTGSFMVNGITYP